MHARTKQELEIRYNEQKARIDLGIKSLDGRYYSVMEIANMVKIEHSMKKVKHKKMLLQLQAEREMEAQLDRELERILGRAVTMEDLEALYQ